ncbi:hypothetical protein FBULB1_1836 [Fusarium bulbicola]|nr:hypothetical protein FBULB1_1836 [Fusarium bulbicola]
MCLAIQRHEWSPDQGQAQRILDDSNTVFHPFPELAVEIRLRIWDLANSGIIDVYCDEDGIRQAKPHPLLSTCPESRSVYLHGATHLRGTGSSGDAKLANIPFHFDHDHFRLHYPNPIRNISLRRLLDHSTKITLPPDSFENSKWLSRRYPKQMDVRVCLADIPIHLILSPPSAFRDSCPADVYKKIVDTYQNAQEETIQGVVSMLQGQGLSPPSHSLVEMVRAGVYRDLLIYLKAWDLMLDKDLPYKPTVEEIRNARLPMLVYVPCPPVVIGIMGLEEI